MNLHVAVLLVYAAILMGVGLWIGRRVRNSSDFFVAGRRLGPSLLFSTMLAANIGAGSTVAAAGLGYADGLSAWWWVGSAGLGSIVLAVWIGPRIRRIAAEQGLHTVGDYLEYRFGEQVRTTITVLLWMGTLAILAAQIIGIGWILNVVVGLPPWLGCLIGGGVVIVYFTAGGLLTAAWVNAVQLVVLLAGFAVALPLTVASAGGWGAVHAATQAVDGYWNVWQGGSSGWFYLAMLGPAFIISPGLLQKTYGARDDRTVRLGVGLNAAVLLVFAALPPLLGMIARAVEPGLDNPELALPTLLMEALPPAVGALGLAAIFSAEVSSSDAILFMLATSLSQDLYRRYVDPDASDRRILKVARRAAVAGGILGTGLAVGAASMVSVLGLFYNLLTVSLFVPVLGGLYTRRVGPAEAMGAIAGGVGTYAAVEVLAAGAPVLGMTPAMVGLLGALAGCGLTAAARARRDAPRRRESAP